jgi:carboxynorspermidine decarboxylase
MKPAIPYYLLDEKKLKGNLEIIQSVGDFSGAKFLLALKCFADAAGYSNLNKNCFNGVNTPSIAVKRLSSKVAVVKQIDKGKENG